MAAERTDLAYVNSALALLGEDELTVISGTEGATGAAAELLYQRTKETLLGSSNWDFARVFQKSSGTLVVSTSPSFDFWTYTHVLPPSMIKLLGITNTSGTFNGFAGTQSFRGTPEKNYSIHRDPGDNSPFLFTDFQDITLVYVDNVLEADFPEYFQNALVMSLAAALAMPVTADPNMANFYLPLARDAVAQAHVEDYNQGPPVVLNDGGLLNENA